MRRFIDPDTLLARRIEGGPEYASSPLDKAQDVLARNEGGNRYHILHDTFATRDDDTDPFDGWDTDNVTELMRCTIGEAEDFVAEYDQMSDDERARLFPDPNVAELVRVWADLGRS
jgi:hypothetical protein